MHYCGNEWRKRCTFRYVPSFIAVFVRWIITWGDWYSCHCWHLRLNDLCTSWYSRSSLSLGDSNLKKTCFETCNIFSDAIKEYYVVTSHETGFKTCFSIIQHSFKTCFGIIQHQLDEEKKVYKLEVISTVCLTYTNVWESMRKPCSGVQFIKKPYFYITSHVRICISTTNHARICIRYCKSCTVSEHVLRFVIKFCHHRTRLYCAVHS